MSDEKLESKQDEIVEETENNMENNEDSVSRENIEELDEEVPEETVDDVKHDSKPAEDNINSEDETENIDLEEPSEGDGTESSEELNVESIQSGNLENNEESVETDSEEENKWQVPKEELTKIIEGILFVSGRVITLQSLSKAVPDSSLKEVREVIGDLIEKYGNENRGFHLEEINKGYQFRSDPICAPFIREMLKARPTRLSRAALETLAIIAYRQPVTRADIEDIRGVDAGGVMKTLLEKKLVKILGKLEEPGRPMIYGTTKGFLETFHMRSLRDLPTLQEFQELSEEHRAIVDATYSRDEVAQAEEEQDSLFVVPESHADESNTAKELARAAENLEMAVKVVDDTVDEIMNRTPYDEMDEDEQLELEPALQVEVLAGEELIDDEGDYNSGADDSQTNKPDDE